MAKAEKLPMEQAWKNWGDCLNGDDPNSIFRQIYLMIWDTAIFRIIIEGRQSQTKKNPQEPEINGALHSFIDRNYFQSQSAFIRRLTDQSYGLTGKKGIYSIGALINDIGSYKAELTRETYLKFRNKPYDYTEIQKKRKEFFRNQSSGQFSVVPPEYNWESIEEAHRIFDRLAGVLPDNRNPSDQIVDHVFIRLQERLSACQGITKYVDKFIAHSATPESRSILDETQTKLTFGQLCDAHRTIYQVAEFLSEFFFSVQHLALAFEDPSFYDHWDCPLFDKVTTGDIKTTLENYRKETESWVIPDIDHIYSWLWG